MQTMLSLLTYSGCYIAKILRVTGVTSSSSLVAAFPLSIETQHDESLELIDMIILLA